MPVRKCMLVWLLVALVAPAAACASEEADVGKMFPDLDGWIKDGEPELYYADNLWEYINGAADFFILYDFHKVATLTYDQEPKKSLTIDIYEHGSSRDAFGIYSQERPGQGEFLDIGTQGYYEQGILNFFQGNYYVKLMGFYLGEQEEAFLGQVARSLAGSLEGKKGFPEVLDCFPEDGKVPNSERYMAKDFLGRSFLHSAFTAEYGEGDDTRRVFIIETADAGQAGAMLGKYLEKVEAGPAAGPSEDGVYRFEDPYFKSDGKLNIKTQGRYLWGLFCEDKAKAVEILDAIESNLAEGKHI